MHDLNGRYDQLIERAPDQLLESAKDILRYSLDRKHQDPSFKEGTAGFQQEVVCALLAAERSKSDYQSCMEMLNNWINDESEEAVTLGLDRRTRGAFGSYLIVSTFLRNNIEVWEIPESVDINGLNRDDDETISNLPPDFDGADYKLPFDYLVKLPGGERWIPIDVKSGKFANLRTRIPSANKKMGYDTGEHPYTSTQHEELFGEEGLKKNGFGVISFPQPEQGSGHAPIQYIVAISTLAKVTDFQNLVDMDNCRPNNFYSSKIITHIIDRIRE